MDRQPKKDIVGNLLKKAEAGVHNNANPFFCRVCNDECHEEKVFKDHLRKHHQLTAEKYYKAYIPKFDKLDQIQIEFKNPSQYFFSDFNNKNNMYKWLKLQSPTFAQQYIVSKLIEYFKYKQAKFFPSWIELHFMAGFCGPSRLAGFFNSFSSLIEYCRIKSRFDYETVPQGQIYNKDIIIDTREKKPLNFDLFDGVKIKGEKLNFGDYHNVKNPFIFVERKSFSDLTGTLCKGYDRFIREIERCKNENCHLLILVEKPIEYIKSFDHQSRGVYTKATPEFIMHRIRELYKDYSDYIQFIFVEDRETASYLCMKILNIPDSYKIDWQYWLETNKMFKDYITAFKSQKFSKIRERQKQDKELIKKIKGMAS